VPTAAETGRGAAQIGWRLDGSGPFMRGMFAAFGVLARYHRHEVHHLERLGALMQSGRRVVLVGNHVLDVVDPLLFVLTVYKRYGVLPRTIGHRVWHSTPGLRAIARRYRVIAARDPEGAAQALRDDGLLMLFPGAVREAAMRDLRAEPYRLKWQDRFGFLRLALAHDADIVFVAAAGTEAMYYQSARTIPAPLLQLFEDGENVLPLASADAARGQRGVGDPRVTQEARKLRTGVGVADRACDLLKHHARDRSIVILVGVRKLADYDPPTRAVTPSDRETDVTDLLQPPVGFEERVRTADVVGGDLVVDPLKEAGLGAQQQLTSERALSFLRHAPAVRRPLEECPAATEVGRLRLLERINEGEELKVVPTHGS